MLLNKLIHNTNLEVQVRWSFDDISVILYFYFKTRSYMEFCYYKLSRMETQYDTSFKLNENMSPILLGAPLKDYEEQIYSFIRKTHFRMVMT